MGRNQTWEKKMLRKALFGILATAVLLASPASFQAVQAQTYTLRYSDIGPPRGPRAKALMWWAEELDKRSNGRIKIKFFWGQSLVKAKATMKAVGSGLADTGSILGVYTPADLPIWNYANAPFAMSDVWVGMRTWHELRQNVPALREETNKKNVKILFNNTTPAVQLLSVNGPITSIADLKGKKIRATGGYTHLFKALGAVPVKIGFGELYAALDRGTVDATINYTPFVKSYKHYEVAGHLTEANMGLIAGYGGGINLKLFNGMPKDIQEILVRTSDEYMDVLAENYIADSKASKAALIAGIDGRKVKFYRLSDAERARWAAKAEGVTTAWIAKMEKKGFDARGFIATFKATRDKYRKELRDKGYPWTR
ncbi:MAG: C4-dicarboxylate TRAP transporter substrate-binding protein [SAR324 cluster bacterium]|nr:C4-dicarboxylate TRAP transporter substrate-binding protein [SAR324 cluster bacterium]